MCMKEHIGFICLEFRSTAPLKSRSCMYWCIIVKANIYLPIHFYLKFFCVIKSCELNPYGERSVTFQSNFVYDEKTNKHTIWKFFEIIPLNFNGYDALINIFSFELFVETNVIWKMLTRILFLSNEMSSKHEWSWIGVKTSGRERKKKQHDFIPSYFKTLMWIRSIFSFVDAMCTWTLHSPVNPV